MIGQASKVKSLLAEAWMLADMLCLALTDLGITLGEMGEGDPFKATEIGHEVSPRQMAALEASLGKLKGLLE